VAAPILRTMRCALQKLVAQHQYLHAATIPMSCFFLLLQHYMQQVPHLAIAHKYKHMHHQKSHFLSVDAGVNVLPFVFILLSVFLVPFWIAGAYAAYIASAAALLWERLEISLEGECPHGRFALLCPATRSVQG
jgi:hypothetical protein